MVESNTFFEQLSNIWSHAKAGDDPLPGVISFDPERCEPPGSAGYLIKRREMYFTLRINQMYLASNRQWWSTFDPLVVVATEFNYAGQRVTVPTIVGPALIKRGDESDKAKFGIVLKDTKLTGPHPFMGGDIDVSVALYQVERVNNAERLLRVVDKLSSSLGSPADLTAILKTSGAVLDGIQGLLGIQSTTCLAAQRISLVSSELDPLDAGFYALIAPPVPPTSQLCVRDRQLECENPAVPYDKSDFVLWSITGSEARGDEDLLPFYQLKVDAIAALWDGEDAQKRAKANLLSAYQQMRKSADMTAKEAIALLDVWLKEFEGEMERLKKTQSLPIGEHSPRRTSPLASELADATSRLNL